jgi:iron complex outermembrane receptor protein
LQNAGIKSIEGLSKSIPNVEFGSNGAEAKIFIRGVGNDSISPGGETRVAMYTNNVYQSRSQAAFTTLYDIDRVEVLRGPQGTLYGRNAVAGAINIITADPGDHINGYLSGQVGNYSLIQSEGAIGAPITDWLGARIAFQTVDHGGYGNNLGNREPVSDAHTRSVRGTLAASFADTVKDRLIADYYNARDHSYGHHYLGRAFEPSEIAGLDPDAYVPTVLKLGIPYATDPQDFAGRGPFNHLLSYGVSNELSVELSDLLTITSVTGYRHLTSKLVDSTFGGQADYQLEVVNEKSNALTQELRLSGETGRVKYVLGGYYFHENHETGNRFPTSLILAGGPDQLVQFYNAGGRERTRAYAAFGQVDVRILPRLTLSAGLRYSYEKKHIHEFFLFDLATPYDNSGPLTPLPFPPGSFVQTQRDSWTSTDPRLTLSYQFDPQVVGYATYSKGFKSGGFNIGGFQSGGFNPERITDYEIGLKGDYLDGRLRANISAFYYDYSNLQVNVVDGVSLLTINAASAKVKGVEAELTALPTTDLRLSLNGAWLDSYYTRFVTSDPARPGLGNTIDPVTNAPVFDLSGHPLNYAPRYKVSATIAYTIRSPYGDFTPTADVTWTDRIYFTPYKTELMSQPAHTNVDMSIRWVGPNPQWTGSIFVKNLTDKDYVTGALVANSFVGYFRGGQVSAPRTFGAQLTRRF